MAFVVIGVAIEALIVVAGAVAGAEAFQEAPLLRLASAPCLCTLNRSTATLYSLSLLYAEEEEEEEVSHVAAKTFLDEKSLDTPARAEVEKKITHRGSVSGDLLCLCTLAKPPYLNGRPGLAAQKQPKKHPRLRNASANAVRVVMNRNKGGSNRGK